MIDFVTVNNRCLIMCVKLIFICIELYFTLTMYYDVNNTKWNSNNKWDDSE